MELEICEIYPCVIGESLASGLVASLVRLSRCNLRCRYCDTKYALRPGKKIPLDSVLAQVDHLGTSNVLISGGEPLLQVDELNQLCKKLLQKQYRIFLETNGTLCIENLPSNVVKIVDVKCPDFVGNGQGTTTFTDKNLEQLTKHDQLKFVIASRRDYDFAVSWLSSRKLRLEHSNVLFCAADSGLSPHLLAEWMLEDRLPYRFQLQIHKVLWGRKPRV